MFKSIKYTISENVSNLYRIYSIAKYEKLSDNRDSKLGFLWNILNPLIQIFTYWFVFGVGIRSGRPVNGIEFVSWMIAGMSVWFFVSPCITSGVASIHKKSSIITKIKFPVSILPTTIVVKELFNHLTMFAIIYGALILRGLKPSVYNFQVIYYMVCASAFSISLAMITSVLNMFTRDVQKLVKASMRMLLYITPVLWTMDKMPVEIQKYMKLNPLYYLVEGYRDSLFYHQNMLFDVKMTLFFWSVVIVMFIIGSVLMYKFKHKFIDFI